MVPTIRVAAALLALALLQKLVAADYYTYDGSQNNERNSNWGKAGTPLLQPPSIKYNSDYVDASPYGGANIANPWFISCKLNALDKGGEAAATKRLSSTLTTHMATYFGQFLTHDITDKMNRDNVAMVYSNLASNSSCQDPYARIVPINNMTTVYPRSFKIDLTREQNGVPVSNVTGFVDGSQIYGSDSLLAEALKYSEGQLLESRDGFLPTEADMPRGIAPISLEQLAFPKSMSSFKMRVAGDRRVNQNAGLLALHHLFVKNHNRLARSHAQNCSSCSSEQIYQWARQRNVAMLQAITFYDYPSQLGIVLEPYKGYNASKQAGVNSFFTTVAFRYGHAAVTDTIWRLDNNGLEIPEGHLELTKSFYNPDVSLSAGIEPILRGLSKQLQGEIEPKFSAAMAQHEFGSAFVNGTDQVTVNIFRARELGMPRYAKARELYGLSPKTRCSDVTSDPDLQQTLIDIYGADCSECDAYVCGLAESKFKESHFGELFYTAIKEQYERLRDTDRFYFENTLPSGPGFTQDEINTFRTTTMGSVIIANFPKINIPANVWKAENSSSSGATSSVQSGQMIELVPEKYKLSWEFPNADTIRITMSAKTTTGWVGVGFPQDGKSSMVNADIIVASRSQPGSSGAVQLQDMFATAKITPVTDESKGGKNDLVLVKSEVTSDGWTTVVFDRPVAADDKFDRPINKDGSQYIIYAWHDTDAAFSYHGITNRGTASLNWASKSSKAIASKSRKDRYTHGVLMVIGFIVLFPMGGLCARCLRYTFISNMQTKALLFYTHILFMVAGVVLTTVSLGLAFQTFKLPYNKVAYGHGHLGVATMSIVYIQLVFGILRPPNSQNPTTLRRMWDMFHPSFGRLVMMISTVNVIIGIYIYITRWAPGYFTQWCAWVGTAVVLLGWVQQLMDRFEKLHISAVLYETMQATTRMMPSDDPSLLQDSNLKVEAQNMTKGASLTAQGRMGSTGLRQLAESLGWLILNRQAENSSAQSSTLSPHTTTTQHTFGDARSTV